jgi:hypothetical protein
MCQYLGEYNPDKPYLSLYLALKDQKGWGKKTSALFVKNVFQIHHLPEMQHLKFWDDVPSFQAGDRLFLPVDAVIKNVFARFDRSLNSFDKINRFLEMEGYYNMEIWDDLWFWGYITQNAKNDPNGFRTIGFNKGKYWLELFTPKNPDEILEIERRCTKFIEFLPKLA